MNANCDTPQNSDSRSHTENRILKAAEAEFLAKGYAGARTTAIAEAAGVTHAMLHYYFRTKDKLFERILNEKIQLVRDIMLFGIGEPGRPLEERIVATVERHFDFLAANPSLPPTPPKWSASCAPTHSALGTSASRQCHTCESTPVATSS